MTLRKASTIAGSNWRLALPLDLRHRVADGPRRLVRTFLRQGVEHVGDGDDAAGQWDRIADGALRTRCRPSARDG